MRIVPPFITQTLRSLKRKPFTLMYPFERKEPFDGFRGRPIFHIDRCISCGLCAMVCPAFAIEMIDFEGKKRPLFNLGRCVYCFQCAESCPTNAIEASKIYELADIAQDRLFVRPGGK